MHDGTIGRDGIRAKFSDPETCADGQLRAHVALSDPRTIWFNTGTLCNIACTNCYIESTPQNDRLSYLTLAEVTGYLDEIATLGWPVREIGFTGGEPFMNPDMVAMARAALSRGFEVLILTNAMRPMMRKQVRENLRGLLSWGEKLTIRVSLDHFDAAVHDAERGAGSHEITLKGMDWLAQAGFRMAVAGRQQWMETDASARAGYAALFASRGYPIDARDPGATVLFPEMDATKDTPEITTACWSILNKSPADVMCSSSRMVVKRKGADGPSVVACTLLPYAPEFDLGATLGGSDRPVHLNHPHCSRFCVLGGASCSA